MESLSTCVGSSDSPRPESMLLMECRVRSSPPCSVRNLTPPAAGGELGGGACRDVEARLDVLLRRLGLLAPLEGEREKEERRSQHFARAKCQYCNPLDFCIAGRAVGLEARVVNALLQELFFCSARNCCLSQGVYIQPADIRAHNSRDIFFQSLSDQNSIYSFAEVRTISLSYCEP